METVGIPNRFILGLKFNTLIDILEFVAK